MTLDIQATPRGARPRATLLAALLVPVLAFSAAQATAAVSYDAGGSARVTVTAIDPDVVLFGGIDLDDLFLDKEPGNGPGGPAQVDGFTLFDVPADLGLDDATVQLLGVTGSAEPTAVGTRSEASARTSTSITALNLGAVAASVTFLLDYSLFAVGTLDGLPLIESVGALSGVAFGTALGGELFARMLDIGGAAGQLADAGTFGFTLNLEPGGFDGVYTDLYAEGIATSQRVPLPGTLALLLLGGGALMRLRRTRGERGNWTRDPGAAAL